MQADPTYEELAEAIAHCVHARMYVGKPYMNRWKLTVDNKCSSFYEHPTYLLYRFGILRPLDKIYRHYEFACLPDDFSRYIVKHKVIGCSYDMLIYAMVCLLNIYPNQPDIYEYLAHFDVCEPPLGDKNSLARWAEGQSIQWKDEGQKYWTLSRVDRDSTSYDDPRL